MIGSPKEVLKERDIPLGYKLEFFRTTYSRLPMGEKISVVFYIAAASILLRVSR